MGRQSQCQAVELEARTRPEQVQQPAAENLIPVGNICVDCTPVTFETPGQVRSVVSCGVDQVVVVPVTRTRTVQVPLANGCVACVPVVETIPVPVLTTVHVPGVLVPVPTILCPPGAISPAQTVACPCPDPG